MKISLNEAMQLWCMSKMNQKKMKNEFINVVKLFYFLELRVKVEFKLLIIWI